MKPQKIQTPTPQGFFVDKVPSLLKSGSFKGLQGKVEFNIAGAKGGTWLVDFSSNSVRKSDGKEPVSAIVKAQDGDFMALLEGRMSPSDGLLTQRLHIAGDAAYLNRLVGALSSVMVQPAAG